MKKVEGKKILLTGATSGIGRSIAIELLNQGALVALCGRSEEKMNRLLTEIEHIDKQKYFASVFDLAEEKAIHTFIHQAKEKFGAFDILINCAGLNSARGKVEEMRLEDLSYMMKINLYAPFIFMQSLVKDMCAKKSGLIVNILSTVCLFSNEGIGAYTTSKSALDALTKVLRKEVRKNNVRVCSIYPGGVNTAFRPNERLDYLSAEDIKDAVMNVLTTNDNVALDEIVLRPFIETNFS